MNDIELNQEEYLYEITNEQIQELPLSKYTGPIQIIDKEDKIRPAIDKIRRHSRIGFDTESRPSFKKGEKHPVSLIQLATSDCAYLFRINITGLTDEIRAVIEDESITKIGLGLVQEVKELLGGDKEYGGFIDLEKIAKTNRFKKRGVKALAAHFMGIRISKNAQISNWERTQLTHKQIVYAATDAWICLKIYEKMEETPEIIL